MNRLLRQPCAGVRAPQIGPATGPLAVAIDAVVHQPEHRVHGSTTKVPASCRGRLHRRGLPLTVTFLTTTSCREFFDRSNVRTHAQFTPGRWVPETPPEASPNLPNVGDARQRPVPYPPNSYQRRQALTRREPPSGRQTHGAAIVTRTRVATVCGTFGVQPGPREMGNGQTELDDRHRNRVHLGPAATRHWGPDRRAPHSRPRVHVLAQGRIRLPADPISAHAGEFPGRSSQERASDSNACEDGQVTQGGGDIDSVVLLLAASPGEGFGAQRTPGALHERAIIHGALIESAPVGR